MRIIHRFGLRANAMQRRELEALGLKLPEGIALPGGGDPLLAFDVDEGHPNWLSILSHLRRWQASDVVRTEFTKAELRSAHWLELEAWHHGYPQPNEDTFGYLQVTYDLTDWCEQCGIGKKQKAPFQMMGEPRWGRNSIMQLVWVYDELFTTPETWNRIFRSAGVACRPVLNTKCIELKTVVQLVVERSAAIVTDGLLPERCARCGRTKWEPVSRGRFPALRHSPSTSIVRTAEYFGSGGQADQRVIVSREIARALTDAGIRGAVLKPLEDPA